MESTYGDRDHEPVEGARARLAEIVRETAARGGRILIPAFAVGRTQEIIYELHIGTFSPEGTFEGARVRTYVPVLLERDVRARLRAR